MKRPRQAIEYGEGEHAQEGLNFTTTARRRRCCSIPAPCSKVGVTLHSWLSEVIWSLPSRHFLLTFLHPRKTMSRRAHDASHAMTGVGSAGSTATVTALGVDHFVARVRGQWPPC